MTFLLSRSLSSKHSHDCNLSATIEPLISRKACDSSSWVEKVDGSDLKTRILCPLEPKVTFDPTIVPLFPREVKHVRNTRSIKTKR